MDGDNDDSGPIRGALNAMNNGVAILKKVHPPDCVSSPGYFEDVSEGARALERVLLQNAAQIEEAYRQNLKDFGQNFATALNSDYSVTNTILTRTTGLMSRFMDLHLREPATLEYSLILSLKRETERSCKAILDFLAKLRLQLQQKMLANPNDSQPGSSSQHSTSWIDDPAPSPTTTDSSVMQSLSKAQTSPETGLWAPVFSPLSGSTPPSITSKLARSSLDSGSVGHRGLTIRKPLFTPPISTDPRFSVDSGISGTSSCNLDESKCESLITADEVRDHLQKMDDFLTRRLWSRTFPNVDFPARIQKDRSQSEQGTQIFGSTKPTSYLAQTLRVSEFGSDIEPGIEVVEPLSLSAEGPIPLDTLSIKPMSIRYDMCLIGRDSSFYIYGGLCEGARSGLRVAKDKYKIIKRPSGGGPSQTSNIALQDVPSNATIGRYCADIAIGCPKCAYEVDWNTFKNDHSFNSHSIRHSTQYGIHYRTSFLSKCHLRTKSNDDRVYACVFCVGEGRTIDDYDATVFFSAEQLIRHLSKHTRPVPDVDGIKVCYGARYGLDLDLGFESRDFKPSRSILPDQLPCLLTARALVRNRSKNWKDSPKDPDGRPALPFARGANIVGITFPPRFGGQWCLGFHDGEHALFQLNCILLNLPPKDEIPIEQSSRNVAIARWDHKPRDTSAGWLPFLKKEKIRHISYPSRDHWCYSGKNSEGVFGLFPRDFVGDLEVENDVETSRAGSKLFKFKKANTWASSKN